MLKCVKLFFSNDYPIIIIESNNGGGKVRLYSTLLQFLQLRIEFKDYKSFRITQISKEYFQKRNIKDYIFTDNCNCFESFKDIKNSYKDTYGDVSISHFRTEQYDPLEKTYRLALKEFREEILNQKKMSSKKAY